MKVHTREKRKLGLARNLRHRKRVKKNKSKTFKSEESLKRYAQDRGIENYNIINLRIDKNKKKLKIVLK